MSKKLKNWADVIYGGPLDEWITYVFDFEKATMEANRGQNLCQETTPCKILDENVIKITILADTAKKCNYTIS